MNKIIFVTIAMVLHYVGLSQGTKFDPKIFEAKTIYMYGYDFSHFKFIDTKSRSTDLVKDCLNGWVTFVNEKRGSQKFLKNLLDKDEVIMDYDPTQRRYSKIDMAEHIGVAPSYVNMDSIDVWVQGYSFPQKDGIGLMAFVDCFYKPDKLASMVFVFFDLSTKQVLSKERAISKNAEGYGLVNCWGVGMNETIGSYDKIYNRARKTYKKSLTVK